MIGFFPDPYPDELLYSICARYHYRVGYREKISTARDLFNARTPIGFTLPNWLKRLISVLPPGHCYSVDQLIDEHTLLPFYEPFLSPERVGQIRYVMGEKRRGTPDLIGVGAMLPAKTRPESLRYCPACVDEDRRQYGEAYWHRTHQAPGVTVCAHHTVWLEPSRLQMQYRERLQQGFLAAEQVVTAVPGRLLKKTERDHQAHLWIARETEWLLNHRPGANAPEQLLGRYHGLLLARRLASYAGIIRMKELQEEFRRFHSEELLTYLDCRLDLPSNWLVQLMKRGPSAHHPLHHLFMMRFLGRSAAEFFQLPTRPQPFGSGPWPCLNPVCEHYRELRIEKFKIRYMGIGDRPKKKAANFRCVCGFTYSRPFPNSATQSDTENYRVMDCGPVWKEALRRLYQSKKYRLREIAEKLGVSRNVIEREIRKLRRERKVPDNYELAKHARSLAKAEAMKLKRAECREQWLQAMKNHPTASRTQLCNIEVAASSWLRNHDREWIEAVSPLPRPKQSPPPLVDWKQRDSELAAKARAVAERIRQTPGRPIRISRSAIGRELGGISAITEQAHRLPLTMAVLAEFSESSDEYAVRRIQWVVESFRMENQSPAGCWPILKRASVAWKTVREAPTVKAALRRAAQQFGISVERVDDHG